MKIVNVSIAWPGASPADVEQGLATPVELALNSLTGVKKITSVSAYGSMRAVIEFTQATSINQALNEVKNNLDSIKDNRESSRYSTEVDATPQVYNISDNLYRYEDAEAVCKAHNSDLADLDQVIDAYNNGADWCNYGWSKDQLALFPIQKKKLGKTKRE